MAEHEDFLGQPIEEGDYVLGSSQQYMTPQLFQIINFTRLKVRVQRVGTDSVNLRTASDLVKLDPQLITMYKLKQAQRDK